MFIVQTKDTIYRSKRKLDATYKHVTFRYKDKAKFREVTETQMKSLERTGKRIVEL